MKKKSLALLLGLCTLHSAGVAAAPDFDRPYANPFAESDADPKTTPFNPFASSAADAHARPANTINASTQQSNSQNSNNSAASPYGLNDWSSNRFGQNSNIEVPRIGAGVGLIDQQKERMIGEKVSRQVHQQMPVLLNPWLDDQFMQIFAKLMSQTELGKPVGLVVINDAQINAFAVPGGLFAINTGLVTSAKNMDEVAGVMAHEIAHVTQRHYSRSQEAFKGQGLLALAGILVGAAIAATADGDVGSAVMMGTQAAMVDRQLNYSRNQEREADRIGMQFMSGARFNPQAMADFFETMNRATTGIGFLPDFWLTHPLSSERMSEARLRANQLPNVPYSSTQSDFELIKWYTAVLSKQTSESQLKIMAERNHYPALIALSAYDQQRGDYESAQKWMDRALKIRPQHTLSTLIQTDIYLGKNQPDLALQEVAGLQRIMPENRALTYKLAEVYIRQKNSAAADRLLRPFSQRNPRDIVAWRLLQQSASVDQANPMQTINVLRYRAEAEYWSGAEERAIKSLLHAQRLSKDNQSMSSQIDARLKTIVEERRMKI